MNIICSHGENIQLKGIDQISTKKFFVTYLCLFNKWFNGFRTFVDSCFLLFSFRCMYIIVYAYTTHVVDGFIQLAVTIFDVLGILVFCISCTAENIALCTVFSMDSRNMLKTGNYFGIPLQCTVPTMIGKFLP